MSAISLDLSGKLPLDEVAVFRLINEVAEREQMQFFVVGAKARALVLHYAYGIPQRRATNDIDFGLLMSGWDEFDRTPGRVRVPTSDARRGDTDAPSTLPVHLR